MRQVPPSRPSSTCSREKRETRRGPFIGAMSLLLYLVAFLCTAQVAAYLSAFHSPVLYKYRMYYKRPATDAPSDEDEINFDEFFDKRMNKPVEMDKPEKKKKSGPSFLYGLNRWEVLNRAVVAGVFVAGIGTGITIDSAINTNPDNLASRDAIDRNAPNPKLCLTYGYVYLLIYLLVCVYSLIHSYTQIVRYCLRSTDLCHI